MTQEQPTPAGFKIQPLRLLHISMCVENASRLANKPVTKQLLAAQV